MGSPDCPDGKAAPSQPRASAPAARKPPPLETIKKPDQTGGEVWTEEEAAAAAALAASLAALGFTWLASLLLRIRAGLPRSQALADLLAALRGHMPPDPFQAWKDKYTRLGWQYREANGVASFVPVDGSRNEQGWVFDGQRGGFVPPTASPNGPQVGQHDGEVDPATGKVWFENGREWVSREYYEQERARTGRYAAQEAAQRAETDAANRAASQADSARTAQMAHDIATQEAAIAARDQAAAAENAAVLARLRQAYAAEGRSTDDINRLAASGNSRAIASLYEDHLRRVIGVNSAEAASQARWADAMAVGEYAARATLAAAKTGMMVVGGPAGYGAVALGSGMISAAQEGTEAFVRGQGARAVVKGLATGFVSGAKDGAIGRYVNMPGLSAGTRVLVPAIGDAAEAYWRTGDGRVALGAGLLSYVGGEAGSALSTTLAPTLARDASQTVLSGVLGGTGRLLSDGQAAEGFVDGIFNGLGSVAGGHLASANVPMTPAEIQMDRDAAAAMGKGHALIEDFARARTPEEQAAAVNRVLENHEAKLLMKNEDNYPTLKNQFAQATDEHRTQPVLQDAASTLNGKYGVLTVNEAGEPVIRAVTAADFQSGSSSSKQPGMDLDLFTDAKIVDREAFEAAKSAGTVSKLATTEPDVVTAAIEGAARGRGIDPGAQEINVISRYHPEALNKPEGESLKSFLGRPGSYSGTEAQSASEVTAYKLTLGEGLPGGDGVALSETCRTAMKDYNRFTRPMMESHPDAVLPDYLRRVDGSSGRSALDIMKAVGDGTLPPGTGNAQFRALTGMNLDSASQKLSQLPEAIAKLGSGDGQRHDYTTYFVVSEGRAIAQAAVRDAIRSATSGGGP